MNASHFLQFKTGNSTMKYDFFYIKAEEQRKMRTLQCIGLGMAYFLHYIQDIFL